MFDALVRLARRVSGRGDAADGDTPGVVRHLAEAIHRRERAAGGWASEVGVLPADAFEDEAERIVTSISLGGGQGGAPAP